MIQVTRKPTLGRPSRFDEADKDRIVMQYNMGATTAELAAEYNVSAQTIRRILRERRKEA